MDMGVSRFLEISAPTGGASGYLQSHFASAGRVGRERRAGGGGSKGWLIPCTWRVVKSPQAICLD